MIRLRSAAGAIIPLPSGVAAIEICSVEGQLCRLIIPGADGRISLLDSADDEFIRYAKAVNAITAPTVTLTKSTID